MSDAPESLPTVDMNAFRRDGQAVVGCALIALSDKLGSKRVLLDGAGLPLLQEYDRVAALLREYGVLNARIDWCRKRQGWVIG